MKTAGTHQHNPDPHYTGTDRLTIEGRDELSDSEFGLPDKSEFPMPNAEHVRAAESRFHFASDEDKPELACRILAKAHEFGMDVKRRNVLDWANKCFYSRHGTGEIRTETNDAVLFKIQ